MTIYVELIRYLYDLGHMKTYKSEMISAFWPLYFLSNQEKII